MTSNKSLQAARDGIPTSAIADYVISPAFVVSSLYTKFTGSISTVSVTSSGKASVAMIFASV